MGHLDSQRSLPGFGPGRLTCAPPSGRTSSTTSQLFVSGDATNLPATPWLMQRDVPGEVTAETGYKPVAFVAIDDRWTALRFKRA